MGGSGEGMSADDILDLSQGLFQGVSEGLTVWKLELHPDSFAGAVLSEVAIHHTKSTAERITVISDNMNESHIGDMFARSMQGQLEGLSKFMSDSNISAGG